MERDCAGDHSSSILNLSVGLVMMVPYSPLNNLWQRCMEPQNIQVLIQPGCICSTRPKKDLNCCRPPKMPLSCMLHGQTTRLRFGCKQINSSSMPHWTLVRGRKTVIHWQLYGLDFLPFQLPAWRFWLVDADLSAEQLDVVALWTVCHALQHVDVMLWTAATQPYDPKL